MDNKIGQGQAGSTTAKPPNRPVKHIELNNSISRLEDVNEVFLNFIEKLTGRCTPRCEKDKVDELTLHSVLCSSPNIIASLAEEINNKISELEELLF